MTISKDTIRFLKDLAKNNNREWFNEHKTIFKQHQNEAKAFFQEVQEQLRQTDNIEGHKIYRIYRDVRFSKDKTPFRNRFAGSFKRATEALRGGYYLRIEPGNSIVGGGFFAPNPKDLYRIRKEFEFDDAPIRELLDDKYFKNMFGELQGNEVKTAPRDFDKDHPAIDLIRKKQFVAFRPFSDVEVCSPGFAEEVNKTFLALRPYFDYMSEVLTTDLNGVSII